MDREGFRNRLKQYKKAREENPGLKYWEWKNIPKYDLGTGSVTLKEKEDAFWRGDTQKMAELVEREGKLLTYNTPESNLDEIVVTAKDLKKEKQRKQEYNNVLDLGIAAAGFVPGLGEVADMVDVINQLRQGNYGDAGISALAAIIPGVPASVIRRGGNDITRRYLKYVGQNPDKTFAGMKINLDKLTPLQKQQLQILLDSGVDPHYITSKNLDKALLIREKTLFDTAPSNWIYHKPKWDVDLEIMEDLLFDLNNAKTVTPERALYDISYESPKDVAINNAYMTLTDTGEHMDIGMVRKTNQYAKGTYEHLLNAATNVAKFRKRKGVLSGRDLMSPDITKHLWTKYNDKELFDKNGGLHLYGEYQPGDIMNIKSPTYRVPETKSILFNPSILSDDGKMIVDWNSDDISFAEGGKVMGPPTESEWRRSLIKDKLWMHPDYYMAHSLAASKEALRQASAELYKRNPDADYSIDDLIKKEPSWDYYKDEVWTNENPNKTGYNIRTGKWYPHKSPEGGAKTTGPGFKLNGSKNNPSSREAYRGITTDKLNQYLHRHYEEDTDYVNDWINVGDSINASDTISPQIKMGLMDLKHQVGPTNMKQFNSLRDAVKEGDIDKIREESTVTWKDKYGNIKVDKRRKKLRDEKYFHYAEGTDQVEPDPLEVLERSKPRIAGIPINDLPVSGTDPLALDAIMGMTGVRITPMLRKLFPNYGSMFGTLMFGDYNKNNRNEDMLVVPNNPNKNNSPIETGLLNKEVRQYYADDVLPRDILTSETDKLRFLNTDKNFEYDLYPLGYFPNGVAGHYDKINDKIRLNSRYAANKDLTDNIMAHEVNHRYNREFPLDKEHNRILNRAYTVEPDLDTPAARAARRESEKRATNINLRHKLQTDLRDTLGRKPTKTEMDDFIDNLSDQELLDMLGNVSSYGSAYLMSIEDRADLVKLPIDQYKKARTTALRKALKRIAMNEDKNDNNQNYA